MDELFQARRRFPVGDRIRGRIGVTPWPPGRTGLFVDLDEPQQGFVDVLDLPDDPRQWPETGRDALFEVLLHQPGQVRLYPLDAGMRSRRSRRGDRSGPRWAEITGRYPLGAVVTGTVEHVNVVVREYVVRFADFHAPIGYEGEPRPIGHVGSYVVTRHLEWTRRVLVEPA